jgi:dihydroneopterin aldolase
MPNTRLYIRSLELNLNLGWRSKERGSEQAVFMDMEIRFKEIPEACTTDNLKDTICYAELIEKIRAHTEAKQYRLIEHLTKDIYTLAKQHLPKEADINVRLTKYPRIDGLKDGVCFEYGD